MTTLLIIEPDLSGHRAGYVCWIAQAAIKAGLRIQLATFESFSTHPLLISLRSEAGNALKLVSLEGTLRTDFGGAVSALMEREFYFRGLMGTCYEMSCRIETPDRVLVPFLDYCANAIALMGSPFCNTPWMGIVMRQEFHLAPMGIIGPEKKGLWLKKLLFLRLMSSKTLRGIFTIDEALHLFMQETQPKRSVRLHYLPDPAEVVGTLSKEEARNVLGIPRSVTLLLLYGVIYGRKGFDSLLRVVNENRSLADVHVLLAGQQADDCKDFIDSAEMRNMTESGRLHQLGRFLSSDEEYLAFKASDIIWVGYRGHYTMSGVMVQAGQMGLPVIACREGLLGWTVANNKTGVVVDVNKLDDVYEGISKLVRDTAFAVECGQNGKNRFVRHTVADFSSRILDAL